MCGIAGILRLHHDLIDADVAPIDRAVLDAMDDAIAFRGTDDNGRFQDTFNSSSLSADIALTHMRLSILDHQGGHQPMILKVPGITATDSNDDTASIAVVFNGCISNHKTLRKQLESEHACVFQTDHSDTEVLLHGYLIWGAADLALRLEGMFAFVIWDGRNASIVMCRDRAGEKPLYYSMDSQDQPNMVTFGSTIPSVIAGVCDTNNTHKPVLTQDTDAIATAIIEGFCHGDTTPYAEIKQVQPGGCVEIHPGRSAQIGSWTSKTHTTKIHPHAHRDQHITCDEIDTLLNRAVCERLESDVPLGCFLSGGVDSSLIAYYAQNAMQGKLQTFSVKMPDPRYDESREASAVAQTLQTNHTTLEVEANPAEDLEYLIKILGQPFGDSSILPTYWVAKAAREYVKVALSGDGGDELFLGYERYQGAKLIARYGSFLRYFPASLVSNAHPKSRLSQLARLANAAKYDGYADLRRIFPTSFADKLLIGSFAVTDGVCECDSVLHDVSNAISHASHNDMTTYLPDDLLRKVDTATMAVALEVRCPFLDSNVIDAATCAPVKDLMPHGERKGLLKQVARKYLPKCVIDRPKMGFAIPIGEWFRSDFGQLGTMLNDYLLTSTEPFGTIPIDRNVVRILVNEHMSERRDHGQRLFSLLTLAIWLSQTKT